MPDAELPTRTTIVAVAEAPEAKEAGSVHVTVPFVPTDGSDRLPTIDEALTKVVAAGSGSVTAAAAAASGPAFEIPIVYVIWVPRGVFVEGSAVFVIETSAAATTVLEAEAV
jgi:hypothetical protein